MKAACPNAVVVGFGVNVGTFNPSYDVETDLVDSTARSTTSSSAARRRARTTARTAAGRRFSNPVFKNQGDCVSYVATGGKNGPNG